MRNFVIEKALSKNYAFLSLRFNNFKKNSNITDKNSNIPYASYYGKKLVFCNLNNSLKLFFGYAK